MADINSIIAFLRAILESDNVYFQPPPKFQMSYPCIVFFTDDLKTAHANNTVYSLDVAYSVTFITNITNQTVVYRLASLSKSSFDRHYISDLLHHYVFTIFF